MLYCEKQEVSVQVLSHVQKLDDSACCGECLGSELTDFVKFQIVFRLYVCDLSAFFEFHHRYALLASELFLRHKSEVHEKHSAGIREYGEFLCLMGIESGYKLLLLICGIRELLSVGFSLV